VIIFPAFRSEVLFPSWASFFYSILYPRFFSARLESLFPSLLLPRVVCLFFLCMLFQRSSPFEFVDFFDKCHRRAPPLGYQALTFSPPLRSRNFSSDLVLPLWSRQSYCSLLACFACRWVPFLPFLQALTRPDLLVAAPERPSVGLLVLLWCQPFPFTSFVTCAC